MNKWSDDEVIKLFECVMEAKSRGKRSDGFTRYASLSGRKPNSVRNYYYEEVRDMEKNPERAEKLRIDISKHTTSLSKEFSREEEMELRKKIRELKGQGYSVRKACMELANGDIKEMLRLQNKYRQLDKRPNQDNIITMPTRKKAGLTEKEITSLFMGLVRLVKKSAIEEVSDKLKSETEFAGSTLRKALVNLSNKEKEYKMLQKQFKVVENENKKLIAEVENLKCFKAEVMSDNLKKFKDFTNKHKTSAVSELE